MPPEATFDNPHTATAGSLSPVAPDTGPESVRPLRRRVVSCRTQHAPRLRRTGHSKHAGLPNPVLRPHPGASEVQLAVRFSARCVRGLRGTKAPGESGPGDPWILALTNGPLSA